MFHFLLALAVGAGLLPNARAQFIQQGGKLVGTGAVGNAYQGQSVAISGDGNTAIVAGNAGRVSGDDGRIPGCSSLTPSNCAWGVAWVYTRSGGVYTQKGHLVLIGGGGSAVAISADGSTAVVGGRGDNNYVGAAWVFAAVSPSITSGGVVNGASFLPRIAPWTWITIQGRNLASTTRTWDSADFRGMNLPTQLDGVSVTIDGRQAYVYFISPTQLNVLVSSCISYGTTVC